MAIQRLNISEVTSIVYMAPIVSMLLGRLLLNEKLVKIDMLICVFSLGGSLLVIRPPMLLNLFTDEVPEPFSPEKSIGVLCAVG
jgi:drug/metabolite transporter (DMT)-like permease